MFLNIRVVTLLIVEIYFSSIFGSQASNNEELFSTSVTDLKNVLHTEKFLLKFLEDYISKLNEMIEYIDKFALQLSTAHQQTIHDGIHSPTIEDPIHGYLMTKRLTIDVATFNSFIRGENAKLSESLRNITNNQPYVPNLKFMTMSILRIQEIYNISAQEIADGKIRGIDLNKTFGASDCFVIAREMADLSCHHFAIDWYDMALQRIDAKGWRGMTERVEQIEIMGFKALSQYGEGSLPNAKAAIETSLQALADHYDNPIAPNIAQNLLAFMDNYNELLDGSRIATFYDPPMGAFTRHNLTELDIIKRGCSGQLKKPPQEQAKLFCHYESSNHPFLKLAPIKMEIMNLKPQLAVAYDVISDSEIEVLKSIAFNQLVYSMVFNPYNGTSEISVVRTSKQIWFANDSLPLIHTLNRRVRDIAGMSMETAEPFQMMNYGVGGHYDVHLDYLHTSPESNSTLPFMMQQWGNRISTVLFYLSDVALGGGTLWPRMKVFTLPRKGSVAFWYNMKSDGQIDFDSFHTACPVIVGSKWALNKWIRANGQMFHRPCEMKL